MASDHMEWIREQARIAREHLENPPKELQILHDAEMRAAISRHSDDRVTVRPVRQVRR